MSPKEKLKHFVRIILKEFKLNSNSEIREKELELKSLSVKLGEVVKEWCRNTTAHGFFNIYEARFIISKLAWIILLVTGIFLCYRGAYRSTLSYLNYEVTTNYLNIIESPTEFPAISICNLNPYDFTENNETGDYIKNILNSSNISAKVELKKTQSGLEVISLLSSVLKANVANSFASLKDSNEKNLTFKSLGFSIETMLISCFFNGEKCSAENFTWFISFEYGNCYAFNYHVDNNNNSTKPLKTSQAGIGSGLTLELFVGSQGKQDFYTVKSGIYVAVHNRTKLPIIRYEGFTVSTGTATNIGISRTFYSRKSTPKSHCTQNIPNENKNFSSKHYSSKLCFELSLQRKFIEPICECSDPTIAFYEGSPSNYSLCNDTKSFQCIKVQKDRLESNEDIKINCNDECLTECDSIKYETTISSANYPTEYYKNILLQNEIILEKLNRTCEYDPLVPPRPKPKKDKKPINYNPWPTYYDEPMPPPPPPPPERPPHRPPKQPKPHKPIDESFNLEKSVLMISVYYDSPYITIIQETELVNFDTLIGIIGGQLGLCIGVSFLSLAETAEMILNLLKVLFFHLFNSLICKLNRFTKN